MPHPKRRHSAIRRDKRRANDLILPHRICPECGYYRGKQAIEIGNTAE